MRRRFIKFWEEWMEPDSRIWANPDLLKLWLWCLKKANYTDKRWLSIKSGKGLVDVEVKKGQFIYGRHSAGEELGIKAETVRKRMDKLKTLGFVTIQSTRQYSIITICNYEYYQGRNNDVVPTEIPGKIPTEEALNATPNTTTKKLKKVKNEKKEDITPASKIKTIFDLWNQYAVNGPKKANKLTESRKVKIRERLKEEPDIEYWAGIFSKLQKIPFYCGTNNKGWHVDIDWIMKNDKNHVRVSEDSIPDPYANMDYAEREYQKLKRKREDEKNNR